MSKILSGELIGKKESVQDELLLLNPHQTPMLAMLGFSQPVTQVEHIWFEDSMFPFESIVTADAAVDATQITVADATPFRPNQVVKVGDEFILVTAVGADKKLTVVRGYAETTPAAITENTKIEVQFVEGSEGADARAGRYIPRVRKSNITQIFDETIEISGTATSVTHYGIDDLYEYEKQKRQLELALQLEKAVLGGIKYENGLVRQMAGIKSFIESNVINLNNAELTWEKIGDAIQKIYEVGGFKTGGNYEIIVPAKQKRVISQFDKNVVRLNQNEDKRGTVVNFLTTDFGEFPVSINNNLDADEVVIIDKNRVSIRPLREREFFHEYLGKKGDYLQGMIVGEYTLEFLQEAAHARIIGAK